MGIKLGGNAFNANDPIDETILDNELTDNSIIENDNDLYSGEPIELNNNNGLSEEEKLDPNKVRISVIDDETPILILFGPPSCGKTMTLIRLTNYLRSVGYTVEPVPSFRPSHDKNYEYLCNNFDNTVSSENAAQANSRMNFMLVQILKDGRPICQLLEGPGEYYFYPKDPKQPFPRFVKQIINTPNRKIWAIMVEPDDTNKALTQSLRKHYVSKIHSLKAKISSRDKIMFIFNKIDETQFVIGPGNVKVDLARKYVEKRYPGLFVKFMNDNPVTKIFYPYRHDFIPFQTGEYSIADDESIGYDDGPDIYPAQLWSVITRRLKG